MYRFIIIDDEKYELDNIKKLISSIDSEFELGGTAEDGQEGLELIKKLKPDIVFTDIRMPNLSGLELMSTIRTTYPFINTVILSAYNDFKYAQKAIDYGACAYLLKPVQVEQLIEVINKLKINIQNSNKIDKRLSQSIPMLQDNLLSNIVTDYVKGQENIREKLKEAEICLCESNLSVSIFTLDNLYSDNSKVSFNLIDFIAKKTKSYFNKYNYYIFQNFNQFCILIHSDRKLFRNFINYEIKLFKDHIENILYENDMKDVKVSIGIGSIVTGVENISSSYREAVFALNSKFFRGIGSIINSDDIKLEDFTVADDNVIIESIEELILSIFSEEKTSIRNKINLVFEKIVSRNRGGNADGLILRCMEVILLINYKLHEKAIQLKFHNKEDIYKDLLAKNTLEDLKVFFIREIEQITEELGWFKTNNSNWFIVKIKEYVNEHYAEKVTLEDVAKIVYLNPSYVSVFFKEKTGVHFSDYTLQIRINKAKEMLKKSNFMVYEIAEKLGFSDYRYFCKVFKKEVSMSPLEFRNSHL